MRRLSARAGSSSSRAIRIDVSAAFVKCASWLGNEGGWTAITPDTYLNLSVRCKL